MAPTNGTKVDDNFSIYQRAFKKSQKTPSDIEESLSEQKEADEVDGPGTPEARDGQKVDIGYKELEQSIAQKQHWQTSNTHNAIQHNNAPEYSLHVTDEYGELVPSYRIAEDTPIPRSFEDIEEDSTSQNNQLQNLKESLRLVDDWSDAEQSFQANRSQRSAPSWLSKKQGDGNESDSSNDAKAGNDPDDEAYDSDLVSEPDDEVRVARVYAKNMKKWKAQASGRFENMLLECIVNTDHIPAKYSNIYVDKEVIRQLERVTRLSLTRKKAFSVGVLKGNRVTGAVLWGPPGTGKTLLAKGLAKESGCNMISITTAELWQKCHGEDEKVIKALFSLGRKLNPCIIFLDEADAMLGARKAGEKRHIRAMLNSFLMEWDGLMSGLNSPFLLLATNRPFDLDPAVLRRAPVQIHLDVPSFDARQKILELLLKEEKLIDISYQELARKTHKYSGSDLKNLCVTAATLCVDEQAEAGEEDTTRRALTREHFNRAMKTVRPTELNGTMKNEFQKFGKTRASGGAADDDE